MRKIIAIHVNTEPIEKWVAYTDRRPDKKLVATLIEDKNEAEEFTSIEEANNVIKRLVNPWSRIFTAKEIEVTQPKRPAGFGIDDSVL